MRGMMMKPNKEMAEKMFNRKADPDTELSPKEFLKKHPPVNMAGIGSMFMRGLKASAKGVSDYGKNVIGGAKIVGGTIKKGVEKIMEPTVRVMKKRDAKMEEMDRKAKTGELN